MGRPSLVLWLGDGQGAMLDGLDRAVVGTVAASLPQAARNTTALRTARRDLGLGQMFDLECWRLQLELGHLTRSEAWKALGMDNGRVYRPDRHEVTGKFARDQAERAMNAQLPGADPNVDGPAVDPSIFTTRRIGCLTSRPAWAVATTLRWPRRALRSSMSVSSRPLRWIIPIRANGSCTPR